MRCSKHSNDAAPRIVVDRTRFESIQIKRQRGVRAYGEQQDLLLPESYYTTWIAEVKSEFYVVVRNALRVLSFRHFGGLSARAKSASESGLVLGIWA
jgi:hypothetical protein